MLNSPSFAELFQENLGSTELRSGSIIKAKVVAITSDYVIVDAGLKSETKIPIDQFLDVNKNLEVAINDDVDVELEIIDNGMGITRLSRERAKRIETLKKIEDAFASGEGMWGVITERVRGGFTVEIEKFRAFLPASLLDVKQVRDPSPYMHGKPEKFKIIKIDKKNNNVVVSRKAVVEEESGAERAAVLGNLQEGDIVAGVVKNITDYGAFIDLGGVDGLLHITDLSWKRVRHPSEVVKVGEEIKVQVLKFDREKNRVSLGLKQLGEDPWRGVERRYPVGTRLFGHVSNITDYGCFVEIEPGIEGLVHMSEIDWTNKNINPGKVVAVGQEVEVMILEVDPNRRRISLGMKQCRPNPWQEFAKAHSKGEMITAKIKSITDFGLFLGLDGDIDGLVHLSDLSWTEPGEKILREFKKGQDIEAVILTIDPERERISLGIKQLHQDVYGQYLEQNPKGTVVKCKVTEVAPKSATVELAEGIIGKIRAADVSKDNIKDATQELAVGDEIEAKVVGFDKKGRHINLSIREMQTDLQAEMASSQGGTTQMGDLLKEQMEAANAEEETASGDDE